jgi:hypothetical protein
MMPRVSAGAIFYTGAGLRQSRLRAGFGRSITKKFRLEMTTFAPHSPFFLPPSVPKVCGWFQIWEVDSSSIKDKTAGKVYHYDHCYGEHSSNEGSITARSDSHRYLPHGDGPVVPVRPCRGLRLGCSAATTKSTLCRNLRGARRAFAKQGL